MIHVGDNSIISEKYRDVIWDWLSGRVYCHVW